MAYVVNKPFTYRGVDYTRGEPWEPSGHPNDGSIIAAHFVLDRPDDAEEDAPEPAALEQPRAARVRGRRPKQQPAWQDGEA